jgi:hypothetical protein
MAVGFLSDEEETKRRLTRLREMSDAELIQHGRALRRLARPLNRNVPAPESFVKQLAEAREEWRRRHPRST